MKIKFTFIQFVIIGMLVSLTLPACKDKDKEVEISLKTIEESPFFTAKFSKTQVYEVSFDGEPQIGENLELTVKGPARAMYSGSTNGEAINWGKANDRYMKFDIEQGDGYSPMVDDINNNITTDDEDMRESCLIEIRPNLYEKSGAFMQSVAGEDYLTLDPGRIVAKGPDGFVILIRTMDDQYYIYFSNKALTNPSTINMKPTKVDIRNLSELAEGTIESNGARLKKILPVAGGVSKVVFKTGATYGSMTDLNGNVYKTITIGTQTWMAENLRTTKYRNGDSISIIYSYYSWPRQEVGACTSINNTTDKNLIATQGLVYNYFAATDSRNIAIKGWHVPTDAEWNTLVTYLGGYETAGAKLKEVGNTSWIYMNTDATNESGFSACASGMRDRWRGWFNDSEADYWTTSMNPEDEYTAIKYSLTCEDASVVKDFESKNVGYSIRLIKD